MTDCICTIAELNGSQFSTLTVSSILVSVSVWLSFCGLMNRYRGISQAAVSSVY